MIRVQDGDLARYCFQSFQGAPLIQGAFTRLGGVSRGDFASLNVGRTVGDDPNDVEANHQAIYRALGVLAEAVVTVRQVHGERVMIVSPEDGGKSLGEADALISNVPGLLLLLRFADCVPVFLYAPRQGAVGLAHAGWQGTAKGIAAKTAQAMISAYGCQPEEILAGLGPAIGPCCFEVGPEVIEAVQGMPHVSKVLTRGSEGQRYLDLWHANALQLEDVGLPHIERSGLCTCCQREEFYSHRGEKGHTGRFAAVIGLFAPSSSPGRSGEEKGRG